MCTWHWQVVICHICKKKVHQSTVKSACDQVKAKVGPKQLLESVYGSCGEYKQLDDVLSDGNTCNLCECLKKPGRDSGGAPSWLGAPPGYPYRQRRNAVVSLPVDVPCRREEEGKGGE